MSSTPTKIMALIKTKIIQKYYKNTTPKESTQTFEQKNTFNTSSWVLNYKTKDFFFLFFLKLLKLCCKFQLILNKNKNPNSKCPSSLIEIKILLKKLSKFGFKCQYNSVFDKLNGVLVKF